MSRPERPEVVICTFRVKAAREGEFQELLGVHWPTLSRLGMVTDMAPLHLRGEEDGGKPVVVEIFEWKSHEAAGAAHEHPEVAALWEKMGEMVEPRGDKRPWEFPHFVRLGV